MSTIQELIKRGSVWNFRRVSIKRLKTDGTYDADWYEITDYVVSYPTIQKSYGDNVVLGEYDIDGGQIVLNNSLRTFNDESQPQSIFYGYKTRYRTRVKIEAGFYDDDGSEIEGLVFYGIIYSEPENSDSGTLAFSVSSVLRVFQNYTAYGVSTSGAPSSATMIDRLVKKEVSGARIFDQFLEGANDATRYKINPDAETIVLTSISQPSVPQDATIWDKIIDYSFAENFFPYIDNTGNFVWKKRVESASVEWVFNGAGSQDNDYGINIVSLDSEMDGVAQTWTRFVLTYDNNGNAVTSEDAWVPGDGSFSDVYGERTLSKTMLDLDVTTAGDVGEGLKDIYKITKKIVKLTSCFVPHLELNDLVTVNYIGVTSVENPFILGASQLNDGRLAMVGRFLGSIRINDESFRIVGIEIDLNNFLCRFELREV